ncbi:MAG: aldo/keto reductase, partial [Caldimonas sp.]
MPDSHHPATPLGASGLKVTKLWLGTMMFGDQTDEAEAGRIVAAARDVGVNAIDTADAYAGGESERITGRLIAADRERWVLATKLANPTGADPNDRGLSRRHMIRAVDASLKRLGTDWVDILYLHREDATTPLEETVAAMAHLLSTGKVNYFGVSNFRAWNVARMVEMCRAAGMPAPIVCQPPYNAMTRAIETELLPCCAHYGVGIVAYSPLARGVLTGKYAPGATPPEGSRAARNDTRILQTEFRP